MKIPSITKWQRKNRLIGKNREMSEDVKNLAKVYHNRRSILSSTPSSPALLPEGEGSKKNVSIIKPSPSG